MSTHYLAPELEVRSLSGKGGRGVFATRAVARGTLLAVWGGSIVTTDALARLAPIERVFALQVEDDLHLLTAGVAESADFINHSCDPNAGLSGAISLVALRAIRVGEEICYDYAMTDSNRLMEFACTCGSSRCRSFVRHDDWRRPELRRRYRTAFSPYLLRRIKAEAVAARGALRPQLAAPIPFEPAAELLRQTG